jgi:hypothetical protein
MPLSEREYIIYKMARRSVIDWINRLTLRGYPLPVRKLRIKRLMQNSVEDMSTDRIRTEDGKAIVDVCEEFLRTNRVPSE